MAAAELLMTAGATPATPAAGKGKFFFNNSKNAAMVDDTGRALDLVSGAATSQSSPANPTGTTNTTGLMMGLAGSITPAFSGRIFVSISGSIGSNTTTAGRGAKTQIRFGTGSAPANAAALTGTAVGSLEQWLSFGTTANIKSPFCCTAVITALTLGTAYWLDLGLAAITGDTAVVTDLSISAFEI
jgi:hypothetical protein